MLQKIQVENFNRIIRDQEKHDFNIDADGVYLILFSARCKNWLQNFRRLFNDDDLALQIDDYLFAEIRGKKREFSNAGSWNGNELKNRVKDILIVLPLKKGIHAIKFWVGERPFLEKIEIYKIDITGSREINLLCPDIEKFNGFMDVIIKNLAVGDLTVKSRAEKNDKLELKVDGKIQSNPKYKRYAKWFWYGQELQGALKEYKAPYCLEGGVHSLEFCGQGQPIIESIGFIIKNQALKFKVGKVRLYKDIIPSDLANLRSTPHLENNQILVKLKDGDEIEILNEKVVGDYYEDYSEIWHEVIYQDKRGFILSSFVEINGQEREIIIDLIKEKCWQHNVDANIMLAIAGHESHFKPYACSERGCLGIFQLSDLTAIRMKVADRYDLYQNIDGGVRYYKSIEKKFVGRNDILEKRLVAWHSGPDSISVKGPIDYSGLRHPDEAKGFVQSVLKNIGKKDWFHIISLPLSILIVISGLLVAYSFQQGREYADTVYSLGQTISLISEPEGEDINLYSDQISSFPAVFWQEKNNQIIFVNSKGATANKIPAESLNLNKIFNMPADFYGPDERVLTHIDSAVLEEPANTFYFLAATTYSCGAGNCTWVLYRFDSGKNKLEIVAKNIFGAGIALYPSLDFKRLAIISVVEGGFCTNGSYLTVIDLLNFERQEVSDYLDNKFSSRHIEDFSWKNDKEVEFGIEYINCLDIKAKKTIWLYNIDEGKSRKIKNELFDLNLSG